MNAVPVSTLHLPEELLEAVETLAAISELEIDSPVAITEEHTLITATGDLPYRSVRWLHNKEGQITLGVLQKTFKTVLEYLRFFYEKQYAQIRDQQAADNVRAIMLLVIEAAKQLDKFQPLFGLDGSKSIIELKELRQLQQFYLSKIAPRIGEGLASKWANKVTQGSLNSKHSLQLKDKKNSWSSKHMVMNLDTVISDRNYELFYMRREDGSHFFNPRLIRNIKLVSDFGGYLHNLTRKNPLKVLAYWRDLYLHKVAIGLRSSITPQLMVYFEKTHTLKNKTIIATLNQALLALFLASQEQNLLDHHPVKTCSDFFKDFQLLFTQLLRSKELMRLQLRSKSRLTKSYKAAIDLVESICKSFCSGSKALNHLELGFSGLCHSLEYNKKEHKAKKNKTASVAEELNNSRKQLQAMLYEHPGGPLSLALKLLRSNQSNSYNPMLLGNLPDRLFDLHFDKKEVFCVRLASPTKQEYLQKAAVNDEFKNFVSIRKKGVHHLLIALQERTSWNDQARCRTLEGLTHLEEVREQLNVVTLPIDSDFYHQADPYRTDNQIEQFRSHLLDHLHDEMAGYHIENRLQTTFNRPFASSLFDAIHELFFEKKNVLSRDKRLLFIDLYYVFMTLKLIETSNCSSFSFSCKDGLDIGSLFSSLLYCIVRWTQGEKIDGQDLERVRFMVFFPTLLLRERLPLPERFNRLIDLLHFVESNLALDSEAWNSAYKNKMGTLFKTTILNSRLFS